MKIAIDARELCGKPTGVGRYLVELLNEWAGAPERHRHEWTLYAHEPPVVPSAFREHVRLVPGAGGTRWEQWDFARRLGVDRPDVLFAPAYTAPLTAPCPIALTIHDVSFFARPGEFRWREGFRRRHVTAWAARRARVVVTDSAFSRQQIAEHIGIPADRIRVIHLGMRSSGVARPSASREPLILYVGSIFPRRHVDRLVSAFGDHVAPRVPGARLEIIGENRLPPHVNIDAWLASLPEAVRARIAFRSWVDEETLRDLYGRAMVFAFLSDYEGFGLPPLEALAAGIPPVVLDTPVAREVYRSAALYIGGGQTPGRELRTVENSVENSEIADALLDLLTDEGRRAELLRHAPEVLARYRWDEAARLTLSAITEAAGA